MVRMFLPTRPMFLPIDIAKYQLSGDVTTNRAAQLYRPGLRSIIVDADLRPALPARKTKVYPHSNLQLERQVITIITGRRLALGWPLVFTRRPATT